MLIYHSRYSHIIVATVVALHFEFLLNPSSDTTEQLMSQLYITQDITFLKKAEEYWPSLRGTVRLFETIRAKYKIPGYAEPPQQSSRGYNNAGGVVSSVDPPILQDSEVPMPMQSDPSSFSYAELGWLSSTADDLTADIDTCLDTLIRGDVFEGWEADGLINF